MRVRRQGHRMRFLGPLDILANFAILAALIRSRAWVRCPAVFWVEIISFVWAAAQWCIRNTYNDWMAFFGLGILEYAALLLAVIAYPKSGVAQFLPPLYLGIFILELYLLLMG